MQVNFEYQGIHSSERLETLTANKITKLKNHFPFIISATVHFKAEKTISRDTGMICNIKISLPGPQVFAESSKATLDEALQLSIKEVHKQLEKRKAKMKTHK